MTQFIVVDDTLKNPELLERLYEILHKVAPMVEETTGLPLPSEVRYRLLSPKGWRVAVGQAAERILARDVADLKLKPEEINGVRGAVKVHGLARCPVWPIMMANAVDAADGGSETLTAPRALHHGGLLADEPCLVQMVTHELVHHAQDEARSGTVLRTLFPQHRGFSLSARLAVVEGHAHWVDHQVTTHLFGTPADAHERARRSWRYRLHSAIPGIRRLGPSRESYVQGARLIEQAVAAGGTDLVNRVWKDTSLLPTRNEVADPGVWIRRIAM